MGSRKAFTLNVERKRYEYNPGQCNPRDRGTYPPKKTTSVMVFQKDFDDLDEACEEGKRRTQGNGLSWSVTDWHLTREFGKMFSF